MNRFYKDFPEAECREITEDMFPECIAFLERIEAEHPEMSEVERNELKGTMDLIELACRLNQRAACLITRLGITALSVGEIKGGSCKLITSTPLSTISSTSDLISPSECICIGIPASRAGFMILVYEGFMYFLNISGESIGPTCIPRSSGYDLVYKQRSCTTASICFVVARAGTK